MSGPYDRLTAALADRYRIERELGRGGSAVVYLAEDLKHGRRVALKVLKPELASALGPDRFLREIETAARLTHPHILPLFDSGEADGLLYYVMPYVGGESLRERLEHEAPLGLEETLRIVEQIAGALARAHERGVVHRDIKPANILFEAGQALVADFGIARALDAAGGERMTQTGIAVGTPAYMSPEQATGGAVDARSDVYGLACITYEMLAGEPPFAGSTPRAVLARHAVDAARPVTELRHDVPDGVSRALERALAKDPDDRFGTATEFAAALQDAATTRAIERETRRRRRGRALRALGVITLLAGIAAGGSWLSTMMGGPRIGRLAVLPLTDFASDSAPAYLIQGVHQALIHELGRAGIPVIARQSVMRFADTELSIREIASELGVDAVIEGSVMPSADSLTISTALYDGDTEESLWSGAHASELSNVLALYKDVARSIAGEIQRSLTPEQEARLAGGRSVDPEAYEAYLRGVFHSERFTPEDLSTALDYFETALSIDPDYAPAHLGISRVWARRALNGFASGVEARERGEAALERALALDSTSAGAYEGMAGFLGWADWDWEAGARAYERAIELDPGSAEARALYAHLLSILGRWEEARSQAEMALQLDPLNTFIQSLYGVQQWLARRYDEAIGVLEETVGREPGAGFARPTLAAALFAKGRDAEAFEVWRDEFELRRAPELAAALDRASGLEGAAAYRVAADALVTHAEAGAVTPIEIAVWLTRAGDIERALEWVERAVEERDPNVPYLGALPVLEDLHGEPRFEAVLRDIGLPALDGPTEAG